MTSSDDFEQLVYRADTLLDVVRGLDHRAIRERVPEAAARVRVALQELEQVWAMLAPEDEGELGRERRRRAREALQEAGFGERLDRVFDCDAANRLQEWRSVPHRRGVPRHDCVVAPDYSPVEGWHVLLITPDTVLSCVLPRAQAGEPWQVRAQRRFETREQMLRRVESLSVGMPAGA